jgi:hypothetical protein
MLAGERTIFYYSPSLGIRATRRTDFLRKFYGSGWAMEGMVPDPSKLVWAPIFAYIVEVLRKRNIGFTTYIFKNKLTSSQVR